jgi:hypothetical protein
MHFFHNEMVPETGIEPVRPFSGKRRILSPLCLPISPLGPVIVADACGVKKAPKALLNTIEAIVVQLHPATEPRF